MSEIPATPRPQGDALVPVVGAATDVGRLRSVNEDGRLLYTSDGADEKARVDAVRVAVARQNKE